MWLRCPQTVCQDLNIDVGWGAGALYWIVGEGRAEKWGVSHEEREEDEDIDDLRVNLSTLTSIFCCDFTLN